MSMGAGAVYDRGYRPYEGQLGGRNAARAALARATARRALGIRRSWRQKVLPWVSLGLVTIPAIVEVGRAYFTRDAPFPQDRFTIVTYRDYVGVGNILLLFVAITAADILCPDRRYRTLPLIFARPLTGLDYVAVKVATMTAIVFGFMWLPQLVLFVGNALVSDRALDYLRENAEVIWQVTASVVVVGFFLAVIGLFFASFTSRRVIAGASFIIVLLTAWVTSEILQGEPDPYTGQQPHTALALLNIAKIPLHVRDLIFLGHVDPRQELGGIANAGLFSVLAYVLVVVVCLAQIIRSYRWVET